MRTLPLVIGLLLAAVVLWLVLLGREKGGGADFHPEPAHEGTPSEQPAALTGSRPVAPPPSETQPAASAPFKAIDPRTVPRGDFVVHVVDEAGKAVHPNTVRLDLWAKGRPLSASAPGQAQLRGAHMDL